VPARPAPFYDVAELTRAQLGPTVREQVLAELLVRTRDHTKVRPTVEAKAKRWLGIWTRPSRSRWGDGKDEERAAKRTDHIDAAFAGFSVEEEALVRRVTTELPAPPEIVLDYQAAHLIAGRPQAALADGLLGWGLARALAADHPDGQEELLWAVRLNQRDWTALRDAVWRLTDPLTGEAAEEVRDGAAIALRVLGDTVSAERADALMPRTVGESCRPGPGV
jgi:hypothetical protein